MEVGIYEAKGSGFVVRPNARGVIPNPHEKTDSQGQFRIKVNYDLFQENQEFTVLASIRGKMEQIRDTQRIPVAVKIDKSSKRFDLGEIIWKSGVGLELNINPTYPARAQGQASLSSNTKPEQSPPPRVVADRGSNAEPLSGATVLIVKNYLIYRTSLFSSWGCQGLWGFTMALSLVNRLRIQATQATFATFPAARKRA